MSFKLDPALEPAMAAEAAAMASLPMPPNGDPLALRALIDGLLDQTFATLPDRQDVQTQEFVIDVAGGTVSVTLYSRAGTSSPGLVVYAHGGGMISGSVAIYDRLVRHYAGLTGLNFLSVDYRLAPEHASDGLAQDVLAAVRWASANADKLGIDGSRIALMGDSGGGGVAAAAAILARDAGIPVGKQILIYPMLDDRTVRVDPLLAPFARWSYDFNTTAWEAVLGPAGTSPPPALPPARLDRFDGLAPAYIEVGELDIFRDECIDYSRRLLAAGVSCELHVYTGAPHLFEGMDWSSRLAVSAFRNRCDAILSV